MVGSLKILKIETFYRELEELVICKKMTYMDAIIYYCEQNGLEVETAANLIKTNTKIKSMLQGEGEKLNYLPKTNRLPI